MTKGKRNLWTTVTGGLMLALGVVQLIGGIAPAEQVIPLFLAGAGLLKARDGRVLHKEEDT